jgi:hypothetical protein
LPHLWYRELLEQSPLDFALIVDTVEADDTLKKDVKFGVRRGVLGNFEKGLEDVDNNLLKGVHKTTALVHVEETGYLDEPPDIVREKLIVHNPSCKLVPFIDRPAIDGDAPLNHLVLAGFEIGDNLLGNLSEVTSVDEVVRLEEDRTETRFTDWVILQVELVETME